MPAMTMPLSSEATASAIISTISNRHVLKATTPAPYIAILLLSAAPSRLRHAIVARCDAIIGGLIDLVIRGLQAVGPASL
jgi:hypothetical protein